MKRTHLHPVSLAVSWLMKEINGKLEIRASALNGFLQERAPESLKTDERWPTEVHGMMIAVKRNRGELASLGVRVTQTKKGRKANGKPHPIWKFVPIEPIPTQSEVQQ